MLISLRRIAFLCAANAARFIADPQRLAGALLAPVLIALWHAFVATLGASAANTVAALMVLAVALDGGWLLGRKLRSPAIRSRASTAATVVLAAWTACLPAILAGVLRMAGFWSLESLGSLSGGLSFAFLAATLALGLPALLTGWSLGAASIDAAAIARNRDEQAGSVRVLSGLVLGGIASVFVILPWVGVHLTASLATAALAAWRLVSWIERTRLGESEADAPTSSSETAASAGTPLPTTVDEPQFDGRIVAWATALAVGCGLAAVVRTVDQLMLSAAFVGHTEWLATLAGCLLGIRLQAKHKSAWHAPAALLIACTGIVAAVGSFPLLMEAMMWLTSHLSSPSLLIAARSLVIAVLVLPLGACLGAVLLIRTKGGDHGGPLPFSLTAIALGTAFARFVLIPGHGPVLAVVVATIALSVLTWFLVLRARFTGNWSRSEWFLPVSVGATVLLAALSPLVARTYQPDLAARLLFNTNALMARRFGIERNLVPHLDDTRLLSKSEGDRSVLTLWVSRGTQIQLRENGVPRGFASTMPALAPHPTGDLMLATVPFTLHAAPHRILLLGMGTGLSVRTAQAFPVQTVMCVDAERRVFDLLAESAWPRGDESPLVDGRMRFVGVEPELAVAADVGKWDVIVSNPRQSSTADAAGEFTREFYRSAAKRLDEDGLFCQRFSSIDYGPHAVRVAARTLLSVFKQAAIFESSPGELLLLGTNSESGIVRPGLVERLQSQHVRRALAEGGWDWAVPLTMVAYDQDSLAALSASASPNTAANGRFAFQLPQDLMRWASKAQEVQTELGANASRLAVWKSIDGNDPELLTRLAENVGLRNVMTTFADQPQAYRKLLKDQLQKNKSSPIRQIAMLADENDKRLHPVDEHRTKYLKALGACYRQKDPKLNDVLRLEEFTAPYDPLVSYFVHHEAAELHALRSAPDRTAELEHRLHLAWYSDPRDQSIRPVVRGLELLNGGGLPSLDVATRWDQTNGLLQLLLVRWENRSRRPSGSPQVMLIDVEKSISAAEKAFEVLSGLASEMGIPAEDWEARRTVLERGLVRPLRTYRSQLLPHLSTAERKADEEAAAIKEAMGLGQ